MSNRQRGVSCAAGCCYVEHLREMGIFQSQVDLLIGDASKAKSLPATLILACHDNAMMWQVRQAGLPAVAGKTWVESED